MNRPSKNLINAIKDYRYLLSRKYSEKATLKLVGDRYLLNREERSILYRGISGEKNALERKNRKTDCIRNEKLFIDTYNIIFTLANYLNGRPVFISDDGFLRDAGELRGRIGNQKLLFSTLDLLMAFLKSNKNIEYILYLDQPVPNSGKLASGINEFLQKHHIKGQALTCESPDHRILTEATPKDLVCTSDSVIIQKVSSRVFDLSYHILAENFNKDFLDLSEYL